VADDERDAAFWDNAYDRFRGVKVTEQDIAAVEAEYRESEEERRDLAAYFEAHKGDVTRVLADIMLSRTEDVPRFVAYWEHGLAAGKLTKAHAKKFNKTKGAILTSEELDAEGVSLDDDDDDDDGAEGSDDGEDDDDGFIAGEEEASDDDDDDDDGGEEEKDGGLVFRAGEQVLVRWRAGKTWYPATVVKADEKQGYAVKYARGGEVEQGVAAKLVKAPLAAATSTKRAKDDDAIPADLAAAILNKGEKRGDAFLAQLEQKYSAAGKAKKKR